MTACATTSARTLGLPSVRRWSAWVFCRHSSSRSSSAADAGLMLLEVVWKATPNIAEACRLLADTSEANEQLENAKLGNGLQLEAMRWNRADAGVHHWLFTTALLLHRHRLPQAIEALLATAVKDCGRTVSAREMSDAVKNSAGATARLWSLACD